jgi:hypothetical protein
MGRNTADGMDEALGVATPLTGECKAAQERTWSDPSLPWRRRIHDLYIDPALLHVADAQQVWMSFEASLAGLRGRVHVNTFVSTMVVLVASSHIPAGSIDADRSAAPAQAYCLGCWVAQALQALYQKSRLT